MSDRIPAIVFIVAFAFLVGFLLFLAGCASPRDSTDWATISRQVGNELRK